MPEITTDAPTNPIRLGDWWVDPSRSRIAALRGERLLPPRVMDLLVFLAENASRVMRRRVALLLLIAAPWAAGASWAQPPGFRERIEADGSRRVQWAQPQPLSRTAGELPKAGEVSFVPIGSEPEGDNPIDLAFTPDGATVLILNRDTDNVTFFDVAAGAVTHTVEVGDFPLDLAVTPGGELALVANTLGHTVSAIDLEGRRVAAEIPVSGRQPFHVEITADGRRAVVGLIDAGAASAFSVLDLAGLREVAVLPTAQQGAIGGSGTPALGISNIELTRFALSHDGGRAILPSYGEARVLVYDLASGQAVASIPTAGGPLDVDVSPDGTFAVVGHEIFSGTGSITRIDLESFETRVFPLPTEPFFQVNRITPDGRHAVTGGFDPAGGRPRTLLVDLESGAVAADLAIGRAVDVAFSGDDRAAFVVTPFPYVLDLATLTLRTLLPGGSMRRAAAAAASPRAAALNTDFGEELFLYDLGLPDALAAVVPSGELPEVDAPRQVTITPDGRTAIVASSISDNLTFLDLATESVRTRLDVGGFVRDLAITPDGRWAVVLSRDSSTVAVVDVATAAIVAEVGVTGLSGRMVLAPDGRRAYVASQLRRLDVVDVDGPASRLASSHDSVPLLAFSGPNLYEPSGGMAVSADGSVVAVCGTLPYQLLLFDTAAEREIARLAMGPVPFEVALAADGSRAWVALGGRDEVWVVGVGEDSASVEAIVPVVRPYSLRLDRADEFVYVSSMRLLSGPSIQVLDAARHALVGAVALEWPPESTAFSADGSTLFVATVNRFDNRSGRLLRLDAAGPATAVRDRLELSGAPAELAVAPDGHTVVASQLQLDGVDIVRFPGACAPSATTLCLAAGRFELTVEWRDFEGATGVGQAVPTTADTGGFWFFSAANVELVVKVLDGRAVNGHHWVFYASLSNVEFTLRVRDVATGRVRLYANPPGRFASVGDTEAFPPIGRRRPR